MTTIVEKFNQINMNKDLSDINPGDTIKVHQKIKEGEKERIQIFEGVVIARKHGKGVSATITVRKVVDGVGVERIFPVHSPSLAKIEVVKSGKVRRAKLYYLRTAKGKKAKLKKKELAGAVAEPVVQSIIVDSDNAPSDVVE
jgi:large subunit ribosomal protein L19